MLDLAPRASSRGVGGLSTFEVGEAGGWELEHQQANVGRDLQH